MVWAEVVMGKLRMYGYLVRRNLQAEGTCTEYMYKCGYKHTACACASTAVPVDALIARAPNNCAIELGVEPVINGKALV